MAMSTPTAGLGETLVDAASIQRRIGELAAEIDAQYQGLHRPVVLLCVLKGALIFTADLARQLNIPVEIDFVAVQSYGAATRSSGRPALSATAAVQLRGRDVLIVEDIIDTGYTAALVRRHLTELGTRSVRLVTLLDKTARRTQPVQVDWRGFGIPDDFVVGYGLDHDERYRNLADVRVLDSA